MPASDEVKLTDFEIYARESGIYQIDVRLWYPQTSKKGWCVFRMLQDDDEATAVQKMQRFADNLSQKIEIR